MLAGDGILWLDGETAPIGPGDCIAFPADEAAHTVRSVARTRRARVRDAGPVRERELPSSSGSRGWAPGSTKSDPGTIGDYPAQWVHESEAGPPALPDELGERPPSVVNVQDVEPRRIARSRAGEAARDLGRAAGSVRTGLKYVEISPGKDNGPLHCHSMEEELFVVLDGNGVLVLGEEETDVAPGTVVARPAGTGVAHGFRAGAGGLTILAFGTRQPGDICFYPRSNKLYFRGLDVIARIEPVDYWDGED